MGINLTKYSGEAPKPRLDKWPSMTVRVETPNGYLYLVIMEDENGRPCRLESSFGKSGTELAAWANATDQLVNLLLESGVGIDTIIDKMAGIAAQKPVKTLSGIFVKSGPDAIAVAFMEYKHMKYQEMKEKFGDDDFYDEVG